MPPPAPPRLYLTPRPAVFWRLFLRAYKGQIFLPAEGNILRSTVPCGHVSLAPQAALRKSLKGLPAHEGFANHHAHNLEISAHNRSHVASHPLPSKTINGNGAAGRGGMPSLRDAQHVLPHRKSEGLTTSAEAAPAPASLAPAASAPARVSLLREFWKPEDTQILKILLPSIANIMLVPLAGAVDLFWVGRMSCAVSLAGQSAGNQVS